MLSGWDRDVGEPTLPLPAVEDPGHALMSMQEMEAPCAGQHHAGTGVGVKSPPGQGWGLPAARGAGSGAQLAA